MKMAVGAIRESPLREIGRGLFSEESLMSVATGTTKQEKMMATLSPLGWQQEPGTGFLPRIGVRGDVPSQE